MKGRKQEDRKRKKTGLSSCDMLVCYQYAAMFLMGPLVRTWHASPRPFHLIFFSKWGSRQPSITMTLLHALQKLSGPQLLYEIAALRGLASGHKTVQKHWDAGLSQPRSPAGKITAEILQNASFTSHLTCETRKEHVNMLTASRRVHRVTC